MVDKDKESEIGGWKKEDGMWKTQMTKTDRDQEKCVVSWTVNQSSAQFDLLRDVAQIQADAARFQETHNWKKDGAAEEIGWRLFRAENGRKATVVVKRRHLGLFRHSRVSLRWAMVELRSVMLLALFLPNTLFGEVA